MHVSHQRCNLNFKNICFIISVAQEHGANGKVMGSLV